MFHASQLLTATITLLGFVLVNLVVRQQKGLRRIARRRGKKRKTSWERCFVLFVVGAAAACSVDFDSFAQSSTIRFVVVALTLLMTWKHATQDIDIAIDEPLALERFAIVALAIGIAFAPMLLLPWLYLILHSFKGWTHHGTVPLRILMMFVAYALFVVLPARFLPGTNVRASGFDEVFLALAITCHVSHYVVPAIAKMELGRNGLSWASENRLHWVAASAYSWGWLRFLRPTTMLRILAVMKPLDRPLQFATLAFELGAILVLFHPLVLYVAFVGLCLMHVAIFVSTGILFWEWILVNAVFCHAVHGLSDESLALLFSPYTGLACVLVVLVFPNRGRLWKPVRLAWWDTPYTARVHWDVIGESGKRYGLYNDFLCPHERLFGRVHGYFMVDEPVVTYHLGEVYAVHLSPHHRASQPPVAPYIDHELRDRIVASRGDAAAIALIKETSGARLKNAKLEAEHLDYMTRFLRAWNRGTRKFVMPRPLAWLKAPGGQFYYWGDHPRFRGQEKVTTLVVRYKEEFYDGDRFVPLLETTIKEIAIES